MMRQTLTALAIGWMSLGAASVPAGAAVSYEIDPAHSRIGFSVRHMGLSRVEGRFDSFDGEFLIDEEDLTRSSIRVEIDADTVTTFHTRRDSDLRGEDFFDVDNYPTIVFESRSIERGVGGEYRVTGDLTLLGVTKEVVLPLTLTGPIELGESRRLGVEGELTIDRREWGMRFSVVLDNGGLLVANEVEIELGVELRTGG